MRATKGTSPDIQSKESSWDISEIHTINNVVYTLAENFIFNLKIYKIFFTSSPLKTLVSPYLRLILQLSCILNFSNVSFSSSLNRLNDLSPYQKFVHIDNVQYRGWGFI